MSELLNFVNNNSNWEEILTQKPYSLLIKKKDSRILFYYTPDTDFNIPLCREARGIILTKDGEEYKIVCRPFDKFFNYNEPFADKIDFSSAKVLEKIDGSLIKVYFYNNRWCVSTMKNIDAQDSPVQNPLSPYPTFYDLFMQAVYNANLDFTRLNPEYTYMFELVSPYTTIVIPYDIITIYHIGTRHNATGQEIDIDIGIQKPKQYQLNNLDAIKKFLENNNSQEGFVIVDGNWKRIKVKTPWYIKAHYYANTVLTQEKIYEMIQSGEEIEFLSYFPDYKPEFDAVRHKATKVAEKIIETYKQIMAKGLETRKEVAQEVLKYKYSKILFALIDKKVETVDDIIRNFNILIYENV